MINTHEWLNEEFPTRESRQSLQELSVFSSTSRIVTCHTPEKWIENRTTLTGELDLSEFTNLTKLNLKDQKELTQIKGLENCKKLHVLTLPPHLQLCSLLGLWKEQQNQTNLTTISNLRRDIAQLQNQIISNRIAYQQSIQTKKQTIEQLQNDLNDTRNTLGETQKQISEQKETNYLLQAQFLQSLTNKKKEKKNNTTIIISKELKMIFEQMRYLQGSNTLDRKEWEGGASFVPDYARRFLNYEGTDKFWEFLKFIDSWRTMYLTYFKKYPARFVKLLDECEELNKGHTTNSSDLEWKMNKFKVQNEQLNNLISPNQPYNFQALQTEIKRLKIQDLTIQIPPKKQELEQLTNTAQEKLTRAERYPLEKLLKKHSKSLQTNDNSDPEKLNELKEILSEKLTPEELQTLLNKQKEVFNLEQHLNNLQEPTNNQDWINLHPSFTPQLIQAWQNQGFTYEQTRDWINIHSPIDQIQVIQEPEFYAWLRDIKKVDSDWVLNHGDHHDLKQEYQASQQTAQIIQS